MRATRLFISFYLIGFLSACSAEDTGQRTSGGTSSTGGTSGVVFPDDGTLGSLVIEGTEVALQ